MIPRRDLRIRFHGIAVSAALQRADKRLIVRDHAFRKEYRRSDRQRRKKVRIFVYKNLLSHDIAQDPAPSPLSRSAADHCDLFRGLVKELQFLPVKSNHIALYAKKYSDFSNYVHTEVTKLLFFEHFAELNKVNAKNTWLF